MEEYQGQLSIFIDVLVATVLTAFIGLERETAHKPAGMRTNMIVGGATALIVSLTVPLVDFIDKYNPAEIITADPIRVLEAIVVGVSFIGAGTILKARAEERVIGLTTAATMLYCCGIGACAALKQYVLAIGVTVLVIVINYAVKLLARKVTNTEKDN
ncbi:Mg(2+) transport ATPase protein C [Fulvivirga imtechensis AK7]|uniref:Mg(2+) transport ATPase protein C n=1 Tax=Fulvivirga imtechensis AK7 TaxID=1237149 RepID=L8JKH3_9BACT|nr:MgtC/SapB family protein [Fulvivirga imtechensis]ELR69275.1 Mg(2+) transport ATPase protein C [Fulvivirga imtechensis AK7]